MATKISTAGGNWNTAGTWDNFTPIVAYGSATLNLGTTKRYSAVWTAPDTSSSCKGGIIIWANNSVVNNQNITVELQEYNGSSWVVKATAVVNEASMKYDNSTATGTSVNSFVFFKFSTPYVYTTTSSGYYRYAIYNSGTNQITIRYTTNSTSEAWFGIVDNRSVGVPSATDDVIILGDPNTGYSTVTLDGDRSCGSATQIANVPSYIYYDNGLYIGQFGKLVNASAASSSVTVNGHILVANGGKLNFGTTASPVNAAYTAKLILKGNTAAVTPMFNAFNYRSDENVSFVGATTVQVGWYASGAGTTASPLVTTEDTNWKVNDEIVITGNAYNKFEVRYVRSVIDSKTYTLASSVGGAEAGYSNTHYTTDYILNFTKNVVITTDYPAKPWAGTSYAYYATGIVYKNVEFKWIGGSTAGRYNWVPCNSARYVVNIDNCTFVPCDTAYYAIYPYSSANPTSNITNIIGYMRTTSTASTGIFYIGINAGTVENIYTIGGYSLSTKILGNNKHIKNVYIYNGQTRTASATYNYSPFWIGGINNIYENINIQGSRDNAITTTTYGAIVKDSHFGDVYTNTHDINPDYVGSYTSVVFDNCTFGSANLWSSDVTSETNSIYANASGSKIAFTNVGGNIYDNRNYLPEGDIFSTGATLADTTTRTTGGYPMRFRSQAGDVPLTFSQDIPTGNIQGKTMAVGVWCKIGADAYWAGSHAMPRLTVIYDNGTEVYAEAAQVSGSWQLLQVPFTPTTAFGQITVTISSQSDATTTDAYVYFTDWSVLFPAGVTLDLGKQAVWADGLPIVPTISTLASASDVWQVILSGTDTAGDLLIDSSSSTGLTLPQFLALK